jgi:hypothetical protein
MAMTGKIVRMAGPSHIAAALAAMPASSTRRIAPISALRPTRNSQRPGCACFFRSWLQLLRFEEMLLFATQTAILLSMVRCRTRDIIRVDRRLRDLGDA